MSTSGPAAADIRMSDEVRAALGPDGARHVAVASLAGGHCPVCHGDLPPEGPVVVLVARSSTTTHAVFAHPMCAPSGVVDVADDVLAGEWPDETDMRVTAVLLEHKQAVLPTFVAELIGGRAFRVAGPAGQMGDLTDVLTSTLLAQGFALVTRLREAPRKVTTWAATIGASAPDGAVQLDILDATGSVFYTGTTYLPATWAPTAQRLGWCVLYAGMVALPEGTTPQQGLRVLRAAASAGALVGARVPVAWSAP